MANVSVGYYVHHHGTGHMQRALRIIPYITYPVVLFSSAPQPDNLPDNCTFVALPDDKVDGFDQPAESAFMYTPFAEPILDRYALILDAVRRHNITCMYVDVSMEVALFAKLLGLKVGHNVMQGNRQDERHDLLYRSLDFYLSDSTPELDETSQRHGPANVKFVGGISRYKVQPPCKVNVVEKVVISISPLSKQFDLTKLRGTAALYPEITWDVIGGDEVRTENNIVFHGRVADPYDLYNAADIVVGAGGHNTIMEQASLGNHFFCFPEDRPYEEQTIAAAALRNNILAVVYPEWPEPDDWVEVFTRGARIKIADFQRLVNDQAAAEAGAYISSFA